MAAGYQDALDKMHAAADATFGVGATFRPLSGGPAACTVEKLLPEAEIGLEHASTVRAEFVLKVLKASLPSRPQKGDVFELDGGERFRVLALPLIEDDDGRRYTIQVETA